MTARKNDLPWVEQTHSYHVADDLDPREIGNYYQRTCAQVLQDKNADVVLLVVLNGTDGSKCSFAGETLAGASELPGILRALADDMERT